MKKISPRHQDNILSRYEGNEPQNFIWLWIQETNFIVSENKHFDQTKARNLDAWLAGTTSGAKCEPARHLKPTTWNVSFADHRRTDRRAEMSLSPIKHDEYKHAPKRT